MKPSEKWAYLADFTVDDIELIDEPLSATKDLLVEVAQLEEQKDDLLNKLVASEELYISRDIKIVQLEVKNKSLMKLAGMYIKAYEDIAFADALTTRRRVSDETE